MPRHSQEAIDQGLVALAFHRDSERASESTGIPSSTLRQWRTDHAQDLERISRELQPVFAARWEAVAHNLTEIQLRASAKVIDGLNSLSPQDAAKVIQQTGVAAGIATDKSQLLRDKPTSITASKLDLDDLWTQLEQHVNPAIDSTAVEEPQDPTPLPAASSVGVA